MSSLRVSLALAACFVIAACHGNTSSPSNGNGGGNPNADLASPTTPSLHDLGSAPGTPDPTTGGALLTAPLNQWTWIPIDGATCGDGSPTGIGVNLTDKSTDVLIFLEGGGACWDATSCWGPVGTALYLPTGYSDLAFLTDPQRVIYLLNRDDQNNPFRDKNIIYVPYCTGDAFAGKNITTLNFLGVDHATHFVGYANLALFLSRIVATFPTAARVWLAGDSAGGFGSAFNFGQVQTAFNQARVDVIDDSGQPIMPDPARWELWKSAWKIQLPSGCPLCVDGPGAFVDYYRAQYPKSRFGLISFDYDAVITPFMNLTFPTFHTELYSLLAQIDASWPNGRYFVLPGVSHVGLALPTPALQKWVTAQVTDDPTWSSSHP